MMPVKAIYLLFALLLLPLGMKAQDERLDEFKFDTTIAQEEQAAAFAVGAGFNFDIHLINYDELNALHSKVGLGNMQGPAFLPGAEVFAFVPWVKNLRIGFAVSGGTKSVTADTAFGGLVYKKGSEMYSSFSSLNFGYAIVPFSNFALVPELNLGWGYMTIDHYQSPDKVNWLSEDPNSFTHNYRADYWLVQPNLRLEYAITKFSLIRASAGYCMPLISSWKYDRNASLGNVPAKLNNGGLVFQLGVYLGIFAY